MITTRLIALCIFVTIQNLVLLGSLDPSLVSAFGETLFARPTSLIQLKFPYALINTDYVNTATTTGGTVSATTNFAQLQATLLAGSSAILSSKYFLNYQPGEGSNCFFTAIFTAGIANNTQLIGMGNFNTSTNPNFSNIQDGFFFGYNGTNFGIFQYINSVVTFTAQTAWNVDTMNGAGPSGMTLVPTNGNVYKIQYCWLGFGHVNFYIENPATSTLTLVHVIRYSNANTVTSLLNPSLQLMAGVRNSGITLATITLKTPCMVGMIEGYVNADIATRNSIFSNVQNGSGNYIGATITTTPTNVLTIQNNTTFNGVPNKVMVYPDSLSLFSSFGASAIITLYLNPTVGGTPTFTNINSNTSVVSYDVAGTTITSPPGKQLLTFTQFGGNRAQLIDLTKYNIVLAPGDRLVIVGRTGSGTGSLYVGMSWKERF